MQWTLKRMLAAGTFVYSGLNFYFWEFLRAHVYDKAWAMIEPFMPGTDEMVRASVSLAFVGVGGALLWRTRSINLRAPIEAPTLPAVAAAQPHATKWLRPQDALDEFADKGLLAAAVKALNEYRTAKQAKDDHYKNLSPYEAVADRTNLSQQAQSAEIAFYTTRHRLYENMINQLKQGILVGRALPFDDKKLSGDQDWEIVKSSHWSILRFSDTDMETVSGGGRTYKGLQIGKPQ